MCGIAGFWDRGQIGNIEDCAKVVLQRMAEAISHRGPDSSGVWTDPVAGVGFAHTRLAVLELSSAGAQPMVSDSGRFVLVFNGEIYNYREIRIELIEIGHSVSWRGHSDTETLLAAIEAWGLRSALRRCVGMFALALWDRHERRLLLARDRMGEKPLYYGWCGVGDSFVFASELKALRSFATFGNSINRSALQLYFEFSVIPAPYTIYNDVFKLSPGCLAEIDCECLRNRVVREEPYWDLRDVVEAGLQDQFECGVDAVDALEKGIDDAISLQCIADVPVGVFLSGGVDSSLIVSMMQARAGRQVKSFTLGFEDVSYNEAPYAAAVARHLDTDHYELTVSARQARDVIPLLPALYDEPFSDSSQIPTFLVCRAAREQVTVALTGDGGDELFGGYDRYRAWPSFSRRFDWLPQPLRMIAGWGSVSVGHVASRGGGWVPGFGGLGVVAERARRFGHRLAKSHDLDALYRLAMTEWSPDSGIVINAARCPSRLDFLEGPRAKMGLEERMMFWDAVTYLPDDILTKVDRASMGVSLETRAPFMDHRLVELAWRIPIEFKLRGGVGKYILRELLYRRVPKELIERPKAGFAIPIGTWLRGPLRDWAEALIDSQRLRAEGYLNPEPIARAWREHLSGRRDHGARLWSVLMFQAWQEAQKS